MFSVGDPVCYPMFGVAVIAGIERRQVLENWEEYYILQFLHDRMTVLVPVEKSRTTGLRLPSSREDCEKLILRLREKRPPPDQTNWNKRYRENLEKLRRGDIFSVGDVVISLMLRDRERGLSSGERRMFQTARRILLEEFNLVWGREEELRLLLDDEC